MREKMKKFASAMLAVLMMLMVSLPASPVEVEAANEYTITINNEVEGYKYVAYQIFKGDYLSENGTVTLSNIEWGDGVDSAGLLAAIIAANKEEDNALEGLFPSIDANSTAADIAAVLASSTFTNNSSEMEAFAELVKLYISGSGTSSSYDSTTTPATYKIEDLNAGYYLVVNTGAPDNSNTDNTSYSFYMLRVVGDASVTPKTSVPSSEKKVGDVNDSTDLSTADPTYDSTADYDIGDDVPFTLTAILGTRFGEYTFYKLVFHDELSSGLSLNTDSFVVTILDSDGKTLATVPSTGKDADGYSVTNYTVSVPANGATALSDGCSFEVIFSDLDSLYDTDGNLIEVKASYKVQVAYTAQLISGASFKETNVMHLEYSNNPYDSTSTGVTPNDIVTVFNYTLVINKYGNYTSNPLKGASFTLYKYDADTSTYVELKTIAGTDSSTFTFSGLDDGQYKIVESVTPAGYNTADPLYIKITSEHAENSDGTAYLKTFEAYQTDENGNTVSNPQTITADASTGIISTNIINISGSSLPVTGGIGTTIFYIVGAVLVIGAVVLLITKKRMKGSNA